MADERNPNYSEGMDLPYWNQHNYNKPQEEPPVRPPRRKTESDFGESLTIPGEAMSIKQIMERAMGGIAPEQRNYQYFDEEDLDKVDRFFSNPGSFDLTDLDEFRERVTNLKEAVDRAVRKKDEETEEPEEAEVIEENVDTEPTE